MNKKSLAACAIAVLSVAAATAAVAAPPHGKFFAFASVGNSDSDFRLTSNDAVVEDDHSFELGVGYAFSRLFAVRAGYHDFGAPTAFAGCPPEVVCLQAVPEQVEIDGWSATLSGALPAGDRISLFGKLGVVAWDASARSASLNGSGEDLLYGAGVRWHVSNRWGADLSYDEVDLDIRSLKFGVEYHF